MTAPFGITLHQPLTPDQKLEEIATDKFRIAPATPHPSFTTYYAQDSRNYGVVWIKDISPEIENDAYGTQLRSTLERISCQLESRYGAPRKTNILHAGSIWSEPRDWIASLHQNERTYFHIWERGKSSLPDDLESIFLGTLAINHNDAAIVLEYSSSKHGQAEGDAEADLANLL